MQTSTLRLRSIPLSRRLMPAAIALGIVLALAIGFAQTAATQNAGAADPPLNFSNNFLVTGDYVVGGAYGMNTSFTFTNTGLGFTAGTINIPDADPATKKPNPGITGTLKVPAGAQIVAALLYWETVEKTTQRGSGQNGFFGPVVNGVAQTYAISGVSLAGQIATSFSNGGCSGTSTGKVVRAYRADVRAALPEDGNGNVLANGQYQVVLPSVGNASTPLTLGATLVIIYRVVSPSVPLNAIAIYDGAFAANSTPNLTMSQPIRGFYDAATVPAWRLTHIVGAGKSNKFQTAYLNNVQLPNLYTSGQPFPGFYGNWDNTTWASGDPRVNLPNAVGPDSDTAAAQVTGITSNPGCVSWGAVVFSTTVNDPNKDGILKTWKLNSGYTDVATGQHVDLTGASTSQQDVFMQLDHIVDQNSGVSFDANPAALTMVQNALLAHNIHLHITHGNPLVAGSTAIPQQACTDSVDAKGNLLLCPYPNQLVTTFRAGFEALKNLPLNYPDEMSCETQTPPGGQPGTGPACIRQFAPAQKDSYRYGIFADSLGAPDWTLQDGSLVSIGAKGTTVTITTGTPHNLVAGNHVDGSGRVTIVDAISNTALNGTYFVQNILSPTSFTITNTNLAKTTNANFTHTTDPNLGVASGKAGKRSGTSDRGGSGMLISLGSWGDQGQLVTVQAGTILHETGHLAGLGHGGTFPTNDPNNPFVTIDEPNCKSNYQSVMNYRFQVDLLDRFDPNTNQFTDGILDFSKEVLQTLNEGTLGGVTHLKTTGGADPFYSTTRWYAPPTPSQLVGINMGKKDYVPRDCNGRPVPAIGPFRYIQHSPAPSSAAPGTSISWTDSLNSNLQFFWQNGQDIDFDLNGGNPNPNGDLRGFDDWANIDLRLGGGTASSYVVNGGFPLGGGGFPLGGGGFPLGGGGFPLGGGGFPLGGGGFPLGGGGFPLGGGTSAGDIDFQTVNSVTRPPRNLTATEGVSPRTITLNWTAPIFGQIVKYNVYRSDAGAPFTLIGTVTGTPPATTFQDNPVCNTGGYRYEVKAVIINPDTNMEQEGEASNIASTGQNGETLTACYGPAGFTFTVPNAVQGSIASITWTLQDLTNTSGTAVNRAAANTLVVTGPLPNSCPSVGDTTILLNGNLTAQSGASTFPPPNAGQYTLNLDTDVLCAGTYTVKLKLDSTQTTAAASQLQIDVNDTDSTPHVATLALTAGTVGLAYNTTLTQHGGTAPFAWTFTGSLPAGISQQSQNSPTLSGTTCVAGSYNFTAMVTDSKSNSGTQPLTLQINKATTTTGVISSANPSVFQQTVTFTVTVAQQPQSPCTPTGTVTLFDGVNAIANSALSGGVATFTTSALSVGIHNITASYGGDSNFNGSTSAPALSQTVNKANTATTITSVLPSPAVVGQSITVAYTLGVLPLGAGTPIGPTGTVTVAASDGSGCVVPVPGPGMCTLSPPPTTAGSMTFTVTYSGDNNFIGSGANGNYTVLIFVSDSQPTPPPPFTPTTTLPNGVVGSPYTNTVYETGGVTTGPNNFSWTIVPNSVMPGGGSTLPGLSFQPNAAGVTNGMLSGTPTSAGTFTFTAMVTDSAGNTGTQTLILILQVTDALVGDLVVVDGSPSANPLGGTVFRVTPTGTTSTIATITSGLPTGVAVDSTTGTIYAAITPVGANGTASVVQITRFGTQSNFVSGGVLQSPVAVAVDSSRNVYVGDNKADAIYKFNSAGAQVDASGNPSANPFAALPTSSNSLQDIRMAFDGAGNLIVATDTVGDVAGVVEIDTITPAGVLSVLYNTLTNSTFNDALTGATGASQNGQTTYTGSFFPVLPANSSVTISGFTNNGNNGTFTIVSCTSTQLVVANGGGVAETAAGNALFNASGLSAAIETVGGIAVLANGSIDVADFGAKSIFNIANPGAQSMAITTAVNGPAISGTALCCNISGMANPPSQANTTLYLTVNGSDQLQLAVPETSSVSTIASGAPLTFPNDVAWYDLSKVRIDNVNLSSAALTINGPIVPYTAALTNKTGATVSSVLVQAYIDQGSTSRAAGGAVVTCTQTLGDLPAGMCNFNFSISASNTNAGTGTLTAGNATARFELRNNNTLFSVFTVPVTLTGP